MHTTALSKTTPISRAGRPRRDPSWWVPVLLATPALIPLIRSVILARLRGEVATGFIQYDMPSYMANAREYFDQGFHLLYGNPYASYDTPRIYFQPHILLLGCLQQLRLDPGIAFNLFGLAALFFAAFVAVRFYREVVGWHSPAEKLGLVCFFWGGGVLSVVGLVYARLVEKLDSGTILHFDRAEGWWMLNFGRNLVYPTEAFYHGVFLVAMLFLIRRRFSEAIAFAALLSMSHPFTGLEAVLIVAVYLMIERLQGDKSVKPVHLVSSMVMVVLHLGYYVFFLNRFADHRALVSEWETAGMAWRYGLSTFLPALFIVGLLTLARLSRWSGLRQIWCDSRNRLFVAWFLIVFGLTQHYRIMKAVQPIHFAHGYDWMALFFLSSPLLVGLLGQLLKMQPVLLGRAAVSVFLIFFVLDNVVWFGTFLSPNSSPAVSLLTKSQKEVLNWLNRTAVPRDMVICSDPTVSYLVSTYTRVRSWEGHDKNTPSPRERAAEVRRAFRDGTILYAWQSLHIFYVSNRAAHWKPPTNSRGIFQNAEFEIWEYSPARDALHTQN